MTFEIIASKTLFARDPITYVTHQIRLPDQRLIEQDVIGHPGAVAVVPLKPDRQVVMVRQYRLAAKQVMLEIPAGTMEPLEDPFVCAQRELQEEAGYFPGALEALGGFFIGPGMYQEFIHLFIARSLQPSRLPQDEDEFIEVVEMPLAQALEMVVNGAIQDAKTIIGILRAASLS